MTLAFNNARMAGKVLTPEAFGARSGHFIDADTRAVFDAFAPASEVCRDAHLRLLEKTVRMLKIAFCWPDVSFSVEAGGIVLFTTTLTLPDVKRHAFDWIVGEYDDQVGGLTGLGEIVTAGALDADASVNVAANTTAMQAWLAQLEGGRAIGQLDGRTYPVSGTLRARDRVMLFGIKGASRIKMLSAVKGVPLFLTGDEGEAAQEVYVSGVIFDANALARPAGDGGLSGRAPRGSAVVISHTRSGEASDCEFWDSEKHTLDVTGSTDTRTGDTDVFGPRDERSVGYRVTRCFGMGAGDDIFTSHNCDDVVFDDCEGVLSRGTWSGGNSGAFEIDDACRNTIIRNCRAKFCYFGGFIKAHGDATAAYACTIDGLDVWKCDNGVRVRHPDVSALDQNARHPEIDRVTIRHPLYWSSAETGTPLSPPGRAIDLAGRYAAIEVRNIRIIQEGAASDFYGTDAGASHGAVSLRSDVADVRMSNIYVEGFADSVAAVRAVSSVTGEVSLRGLAIKDGPQRGVRSTASAAFFVDGYSLHRTTATAGSVGIWIDNGSIGAGIVSGYEKRVHEDNQFDAASLGYRTILLGGSDSIDAIGAVGGAFNRQYAWSSGASNRPTGAPTDIGDPNCFLIHNQRSSGSRTQFLTTSNNPQRMLFRGYTGGAWQPWISVARTILPGPFDDDAAAEAGGVPVGASYRETGGAVKWRQA